jgi:hypothetical protein
MTNNADDLQKATEEKLKQLTGKLKKYEDLAGK